MHLYTHTAAKMTPPTYSKPLPLPTYTQSEKYEKEGVFEMDLREEPENLPSQQRVVLDNSSSDNEADVGTCCEFTFFFIGVWGRE